jgi:ribosomal protein S8
LRLEGLHEILKSRGIYVTANKLRLTLYRLEKKGFIEKRKTVGKGNSNKRRFTIYTLSYSFKRSKKIRRIFEEIFVGLGVGG